jgi:hypothetical protein
MDVAFESRGSNLQAKPIVEKIDVIMQVMIGGLVALVNQARFTVDQLNVRVLLVQRTEVRVILPKLRG